MKKLLSILATVGLVATTGATVVACGPSEKENTNKNAIKINLSQDNLVIGKTGKITIENYDQIKDAYQEFKLEIKTSDDGVSIIEQTKFEKGVFEFVALNSGSVDVVVNGTLKEETKTLTDKVKPQEASNKITITVIEIDLSKIEGLAFQAGKNLIEVLEAIQDKVTEIAPKAIVGSDYGIGGSGLDWENNLVKPGEIWVEGLPSSRIVTGKLTIQVGVWDISKITVGDVNIGTDMTIVEEKIQTAFQDEKILGVKKDVDYVIKGNINQDEKLTVQAVEGSKIIAGKFAIQIVTPKYPLNPYAKDHKVWIYNSGFNWDKDNKVESVKLNETEWSQLLWTGMFDARSNEEGLEYFEKNKLEEVLHFTGEVNEVLTKALKGKTKTELLGKGIKLVEEIQKLGITLDKDLPSFTDVNKPRPSIIEQGSVTFIDLTICLAL